MTPNTGDNPTLKFWDGQEITSGITPIGTYGASYSGYYFYEIYDVVGRSIRGYFHRNSSGVPSGLVQIQQETSGLSIAIGGSPVKVTLTNTNAAWVNIRLKSTITEISKMPELYGKYSNDGQTQFWTGIGGLGVGHTSQNASAAFQVDSTTKGSLANPRMTSTQRTAITGVTIGLVVYQTDAPEGLYIYKSTGWALVNQNTRYTGVYTPNASFTSSRSTVTITVSGATVGMPVVANINQAMLDDLVTAGTVFYDLQVFVSATDTITITSALSGNTTFGATSSINISVN